MMVDVVTYLFNYCAELLKHPQNNVKSERSLKLRQLYMELIPPLLSVTTLIVVTVMAMNDAFRKLLLDPVDENQNTFDSPNLRIMIIFSSMNLMLDIVNVTCFARVQQAIGLPDNWQRKEEDQTIRMVDSVQHESLPLLRPKNDDNNMHANNISENVDKTLNLNMCSAWTHICADTLRSIAVLVAAGIAWVLPSLLTPDEADSGAAIIVSAIILFSLVPLIQGLFRTAHMIYVAWSSYDTKSSNEVN
jgi:Co/Zn/Cd efflux system component